MVDWNSVPKPFRYFRDAVEICGETRVLKFDESLGHHVDFVENISKEQLAQLNFAYETLLKQGDLESLWDWLENARNGSDAEKSAAWRIGGILIQFHNLAERGVFPFAREHILPCRPPASRQGIGVLVQLPVDLSYLIVPALKYGKYHFDQEIFDFLERATEEEMEELSKVAEHVLLNNHFPQVMRFLDQYEITDYPESADLYFLFGVLDHADFQFDRVTDA